MRAGSYEARLQDVLRLCAERPHSVEEIARHFGVSVSGAEVYLLSLHRHRGQLWPVREERGEAKKTVVLWIPTPRVDR